jgi:hypothetical protein
MTPELEAAYRLLLKPDVHSLRVPTAEWVRLRADLSDETGELSWADPKFLEPHFMLAGKPVYGGSEPAKERPLAPQAGEVNEHEDLELVLFRPVGRVYRVLRCKVCQSEDTFGISLADNGQWNLECGNCYESAAILTEVLAELR